MTTAQATKSRKLISIGLALCFCITLTLSCVCFASPSLDDATLEASIRAYYLKNAIEPSYSLNSVILKDGTFVTDRENFIVTTDSFSVIPNTYLFLVYPTNSAFVSIRSCCFFDSNGNALPDDGFGDSVASVESPNHVIDCIIVPSSATSCRISHRYGSRAYVCWSSEPVSSYNYYYVFGEIENLSISDGIVTIPYQTYSFNLVRLDVMFFDNNRSYDSVAVSLRAEYYNTTLYNGLVPFVTDDFIGYAFLDSISITDGDEYSYYSNSSGSSSNNNPCRLSTPCEDGKFVGFRLQIPVSPPSGSVSTGLQITLSDFRLGDQSVAVEYGVVDMNKRLDHLAEGLAVPTPNINIGELLSEAFSGIDTTTTNNIFAIFYNNSLVPKMLLIAVSVGLVGFVLFGKRGHANE